MTLNSPVLHLSRPLADQQLVNHEAAVALRRPVPRNPQRPTCPKTSGQLSAQRSAALHIERLIDRLMRQTHRLIIGEINAEASGDLLRAPALSPAPVLARSPTPPAPADLRTRDAAVGPLHSPGKPRLHIGPQLRVHRELGRLRSPGATLSMP